MSWKLVGANQRGKNRQLISPGGVKEGGEKGGGANQKGKIRGLISQIFRIDLVAVEY